MKVRDFLYLRESGTREREFALMELLNISRGELYSFKGDLKIPDKRLIEIDGLLSLGVPLYYALGEITFYGRKFFLGKGVLIPRLETEIVIEKALKLIHSMDKGSRVLDLCTGTGILGITIAKEHPDFQVILSDIDDTAIFYAKKNVANLKAKNCTVIKSDLFENISGEFDIIISNPPYIPDSEINNLESSVKDYEPLIALCGGEEGLDFYKRIFENLSLYLKDGGFFIAEIGYNQGEKLLKLAPNGEVFKDFQGNDRIFLLRN